jgi:hypothetical protein
MKVSETTQFYLHYQKANSNSPTGSKEWMQSKTWSPLSLEPYALCLSFYSSPLTPHSSPLTFLLYP